MRAAPITSLLMLCCVVAFLVYVLAEDSYIHSSSEAENRFWTLLTAALTSTMLFARDSPFCLGADYPVLAALVMVAVVMYVHTREREKLREELSRPSGLVRSPSVDHFDQVRRGCHLA